MFDTPAPLHGSAALRKAFFNSGYRAERGSEGQNGSGGHCET